MIDDPVALLERELVEAARRRSPGLRRRRPTLGGLAAALLVAVTLVVAGGAVILLGGHQRPAAASSTALIPGRRQLIDILAVLRRPQTKTDLDASVLAQVSRSHPGPLSVLRGAPDLPLVRLATTTSWGARIYLVPMKPPTPTEVARLVSRYPQLVRMFETPPARGHVESLELWDYPGGAGGGGGAAAVESGQEWLTVGSGPGRSGSGNASIIVVVPDGVARVAFLIQNGPSDARAAHEHTVRIVARVHGNVAAIRLNQAVESPGEMVWYASDGRVIKHTGAFEGRQRAAPSVRRAR